MSQHSAIYSPYGAYELKAKYQRNFALGTLSTLALVLLVLGVSWVIANWDDTPDVIYGAAKTIKTVAELGPPPAITKAKPQLKVNQPNVAAPRVGIPKPVADDEVIDDDVVLATREEMAEIVAPDITQDLGGGGDIIVDIQEEDYLPSRTEFVPVEVYPEMIDQAEPEYPRMAKLASMEGRVTVQVLVDKSGNVRDCAIARSSGNEMLDDAACKAGRKCKFKPGIQNGQPVFCWVSFNYDFRLTDQ